MDSSGNSNNDLFLFPPTPLEEAYTIHILETVFDVPSHATSSSSSSSNTIRISGRVAVPFLRTSGVDPTVLREAWSAVDGAGRGTLTTLPQMQVLVRLVALAQEDQVRQQQQQQQQNSFNNCFGRPPSLVERLQSSLSPSHTTTTTTTITMDVWNQCLREASTRTVALARFEGYPVPDEGALRTLYFQRRCGGTATTAQPTMAPLPQPQAVSGDQAPSGGVGFASHDAKEAWMSHGSAAAASSSTTNNYHNTNNNMSAPFPGGAAHQSASATAVTTAAPPPSNSLASIEDAFGGLLVDVQDAPLPSLQPVVVNMTAAAVVDDTMAQATVPSVSGPAGQTNPTIGNNHNNDDDDPSSSSMVEPDTKVAGDPAIYHGSMGAVSADHLVYQTTHGTGGDGSAGGVDAIATAVGAPAPSLDGMPVLRSSTTSLNGAQGEGGDLRYLANVFDTVDNVLNVASSVGRGAGADSSSDTPPTTVSATPNMSTASTMDGSGFGAIQSPPLQDSMFALNDPAVGGGAAAISTLAANDNTNMTGAVGASTGNNWDALDALATVTDAPLPSLGMTQDETIENDDDFGAFEGVASGDAIKNPVEDATENSDDFGDFTGTGGEASAPPGAEDATENSDDFGDFTGTGGEASAPHGADSLPAIGESGGGWGAFDTLTTNVADAPLPTLHSIATNEISASVFTANNNNDNFESFVESASGDPVVESGSAFVHDVISTVAEDAPNVVAPVDDGWGALDALTTTQDAPLPTLASNDLSDGPNTECLDNSVPQTTSMETDTPVESQDLASGFDQLIPTTANIVSAQPAAIHDTQVMDSSANQGPSAEFGWGALDTLGGIKDAPLPSLPCTLLGDDKDGKEQEEDTSDSFGDFVTIENRVNSSETTGRQDEGDKSSTDMSDGFGDFVAPPEEQCSGHKPVVNDLNDGFGDFAAPSTMNSIPDPTIMDPSQTKACDQNEGPGDFGDFLYPPPSNCVENGAKCIVEAHGDGGCTTGLVDLGALTEQTTKPLNVPLGMSRVDSEYYSAKAKSVSSDSEDFAGFEDAGTWDGNPALIANAHGQGRQDPFQSAGVAASSLPLDPRKSLDDKPNEPDDSDFGDFSTFDTIRRAAVNDFAGDDSDFGEFETVTHSEAGTVSEIKTVAVQHDQSANFGNFASFDHVTTASPRPDAHAEEEFDAFQQPLSSRMESKIESTDLSTIRNTFVNQFGRISKDLFTQQSGECVDAKAVLESKLGSLRSPKSDPEADIGLSSHLCSLLSTSHAKLASGSWSECFKAARLELERGLLLFQEATSLPIQALDTDDARQTMLVYLKSLREIVRVCRMITASIGDILMLDISVELTMETHASSWYSLIVLEDAWKVENLWREIETLGADIIGASDPDEGEELDSLKEIRSLRHPSQTPQSVCFFTLQSLQDIEHRSTTSKVLWEGQFFTACTANFLANCCKLCDAPPCNA